MWWLQLIVLGPFLISVTGIVAIGAVGLRTASAEQQYDAALAQTCGRWKVVKSVFRPGLDWKNSIPAEFHGTIQRRRRAVAQMGLIGIGMTITSLLVIGAAWSLRFTH